MHENHRYVKSACGLVVALALPGLARAEIVAPTHSEALLGAAPDGSPRVAYTSGRDVVVGRRTAAGWKFARAGKVPGTSPVLAGLVVDGRGRTSLLVEARNGSWLALASRGGKLRVVARPRKGASLGPAGLTLDARGRLFNVDSLTFNVLGNAFPKISAELFVDAYVYGVPPVAPAPTAPTTPSTSDAATATGTAS